MSYFIQRLSDGLSFKPNKADIHPGLNLVIISFQFIILIFPLNNINTLYLLSSLLLFVIIEILFTKNLLNCLGLLRGILPLLIITFVVTLFFAGPIRAIVLTLRIIAGALTFSIFIISKNPSDL